MTKKYPYKVVFRVDPLLTKKYGFEVMVYDLDLLKSGWLRVHITWRMEKDEYKVKYMTDGGSSFGNVTTTGNDEYVAILTSPYFRKKHFLMEVGIERTDGQKCDFRYTFFDNIKYGVNVYFEPRKSNFHTTKKTLESHESEYYKQL